MKARMQGPPKRFGVDSEFFGSRRYEAKSFLVRPFQNRSMPSFFFCYRAIYSRNLRANVLKKLCQQLTVRSVPGFIFDEA